MKFVTSTLILATLAAQAASAQATTPTKTTIGTTTTSTSAANVPANAVDNWDTQSTYWRNNHATRPYYDNLRGYAAYEPAYRFGVDLYNKNPNTSYDKLEQAQLRSSWSAQRGTSTLEWEDAQQATRDAYNRMYDSHSLATSPAR